MDARRPWDRASIFASPGVTPTTLPSFLTFAIRVSELQKVNLALAIRFPLPSAIGASYVGACKTGTATYNMYTYGKIFCD